MKKRTVVISLAAIAAVLLIVVYCLLDPAKMPFFPRCPFVLLTGLKCPGCGSQRAIHQLLNLNIAEAFRYNAMLVLCIPLLAFYAIAEIFKRRFPGLYRAALNKWMGYGIFAAFILWWILRNIFGW